MTRWIPSSLRQKIEAAIRQDDGSVHLFYITARGGWGKTVLLRQIGMELGGDEEGYCSTSVWSGVLDLYHSDVNNNSGLEERLVEAFETADEFRRYRKARESYRTARKQGITGQQLEAMRRELAGLFAAGMEKVTQARRVVVALDTVERIQYEIDKIQRLCKLQNESAIVGPWLVDQLKRWRNCVVILAGRPNPDFQEILEAELRKLPHIQYHHEQLRAFDWPEAQAYFRLKFEQQRLAALAGQPSGVHPPDIDQGELSEDELKRLWELTEGIPIRLELALEIFWHGLSFASLLQDLEAMMQRPPSTRARAKGRPSDNGQGRLTRAQRFKPDMDALLVERVLGGEREQDPELCEILEYLAVARRGLNADLLSHLLGSDKAACQAKLAAIETRGFIKKRPSREMGRERADHASSADDERLFLHDEMYRFCDAYLGKDRVQPLSERIVKWYDEQIPRLTDEDERKNYQVESVFYRLRANPEEGYFWFAKLDEEAIRGSEMGFDMRLRNEVLLFMGSESPIDQALLDATPYLRKLVPYESAARWVKRFIMRGERDKAISVSETLTKTAGFFSDDDPDLSFVMARAELDVLRGEALNYTGKTQAAIDLLEATIRRLEQGQDPETLASQDSGTYLSWRRNLALGRAHNDLGYTRWMQQQQYGQATRQFEKALIYSRKAGLAEEMANTNDNMARVFALLGHEGRARVLSKEALDVRRRLGRKYRIALSLNSRAIVNVLFGDPEGGRRRAQEALDLFKELGGARGIGLASISLGYSLRQLGEAWEEDVDDLAHSEAFFEQAIGVLADAIRIFETEVQEPVRLVEAYNELGCVYRERAALARYVGREADVQDYVRAAETWLDKSIQMADKLNAYVLYADSCQDLALTFFQAGDVDRAEAELDRAEAVIPAPYKAVHRGAVIAEADLVEEFWQQMGKIELLRGHLAFEKDVRRGGQASRAGLEEAITHYAFAATYFERFSERATGLRTTFTQLYDRFKRSQLEDLRYLQTTTLPALVEKHGLDANRLAKFLEDTLGLAQRVR